MIEHTHLSQNPKPPQPSQELSLVTVLSQLKPVRSHPSYFLKIYINTIHHKKSQLKFEKATAVLALLYGTEMAVLQQRNGSHM